MAEARVSAVILVYNGERHLAEAIESALAQTHPCGEVIVVDNGSNDRSAEIADRYAPAIRLHSEPRRGIGFARNAGLALAEGDYLAFLDHDDTWEPRKNELQLAAFEAAQPPHLVFGHVRQFVSSELDPATAARLKLPDGPQPGLYLGTMLASRSAWNAVGPWDQAWGVADGLAWILRARSLGLSEAMLADVVTNRRIHGGNQSFHNHEKRSEWAHLLKVSLDQRRAGGRPA